MSLTRDDITEIYMARRSARHMRRYPEGNARYWAVVEAAFTAWCVGVIALIVGMVIFR